jgi:hypothetical protein
MHITTSYDLARPTVPVLWSVALSRLALSILALVFTVRWQTRVYNSAAYVNGLTTELSYAYRLSRAAAIVLLLVWVGLRLTTRLDPGWQQTVRRRRMLGRPSIGPDLATPSLAQVTGVAAGVAAVPAGLLLVALPLPEYLSDLASLGQPDYATELGVIVRGQLMALALLAAGVLAVGTPAAVGRTLLAAATGGLAAGLVTVGLIGSRLISPGVEQMLGVLLVWVLAALAVGGLAATSPWYRLRQVATSPWHRLRPRLVGLVRRRRHPG